MRAAAFALITSSAMPVMAEDFLLAQPIDCTLGETCFIQQYVDRDPGPEAFDFTCGPLSYDGHKGTDFAIHDLQAMKAGVDILAAASGIVRGLRDGEPDTGLANATPGKDCGNGVAIDHADGWATQYCHLKQGSITVEVGQKLDTGDVIGQVGLSGRTEFPHVHISVRRDDAVVDPFASEGPDDCGNDTADTLWTPHITYQPGGVISLGIARNVPSFDAIKAGSIPDLAPTADTEALVLYAHLYGNRAGDVLKMQLTGPNTAVFSEDIVLAKTQARSFRAYGHRKPDTGWPVGSYIGTAALMRGSQQISILEIQFEVR